MVVYTGHFEKGNTPWNKGLTKEIDMRVKKISTTQKGRNYSPETQFNKGIDKRREKTQFKSGKNHRFWKGGITPYGSGFTDKLKEEIRKRDKYICQQCLRHQNEKGRKLPVHHINYDKKNNKPINLITLCNTCHAQTNFNREWWINNFKNKIIEVV